NGAGAAAAGTAAGPACATERARGLNESLPVGGRADGPARDVAAAGGRSGGECRGRQTVFVACSRHAHHSIAGGGSTRYSVVGRTARRCVDARNSGGGGPSVHAATAAGSDG